MNDKKCDNDQQPQTMEECEKLIVLSHCPSAEDKKRNESSRVQNFQLSGQIHNELTPIITPDDSDDEKKELESPGKLNADNDIKQSYKEQNNNENEYNVNKINNNTTAENASVEVNSAYSSSLTLSTIGKTKTNQFLQTLKQDSVGAVYVAKPGEEELLESWEEDEYSDDADVVVPAEVLYTTPPECMDGTTDVSRPSSGYNSPSADDEKTSCHEKKRGIRAHRMTPKLHRRTRSGDEVAANLMGRQDWVGMTYHDLPLPGTDDDDSEHASDVNRSSGFHSRKRRSSSGSTSHQIDDTLNSDPILYSGDSRSYTNQSEHFDTECHSSVFSWLSRPSSVSPTPTTDKDQMDDMSASPIKSPRRSISPNIPTMSPLKEDVLQSIRTFDISEFNPFQSHVSDDEADKYATFICPNCKTRQRQFFNINTVQGQFESPAGYFAVYIATYVMASLFLFGLQEGWSFIDCIYFSVITLTTAGLGDFVPSSDAAKLFCCIFIYFGVACIGLLLGSLLASGLDDKSRQEADEQLMSCLQCNHQFSRDKKTQQSQIHNMTMSERLDGDLSFDRFQKFKPSLKRIDSSKSFGIDNDTDGNTFENNIESDYLNYSSTDDGGQDYDIKFNSVHMEKNGNKVNSYDIGQVNENTPFISKPNHMKRLRNRTASDADVFGASYRRHRHYTADFNAYHSLETSSFELEQNKMPDSFDTSSQCTDSYSSDDNEILPNFKIKNAKYVFQTVKQAIVNSIFIIFIGSVGFHFIEGWRIIDSFYFTTVLLTTVGYGDIVPKTSEGKLFATGYVLVAGTVLLNNMSTISMIPLELRRRRQETAVLRQFGDHLDDAALRELASGPLVRRLYLTPRNQNDGGPHLNECTREMFSLAMLVRLGRISEQDIQSTFNAFSRLDCDNDGKLSSKDIICGRVKSIRREKRRNSRRMAIKVAEEQNTNRRYFTSPDTVTMNQTHQYDRNYQDNFTVAVSDMDEHNSQRNFDFDQIDDDRHYTPNNPQYQNIPYVPNLGQPRFDSNMNDSDNHYNNTNFQMDIESGEVGYDAISL